MMICIVITVTKSKGSVEIMNTSTPPSILTTKNIYNTEQNKSKIAQSLDHIFEFME